VIAPTLGGLAIAAHGVRGGVHIGLVITIVLALITLAVVWRVAIPVVPDHAPTNVLSVWRTMPESLRWLLASDVCIRTCDGLVDIFLVLYAINVVGLDAPQYGALVAVQMTTAILSYLPSAPLADRIGRKPFVVATFIAFTLFPLAVVMSGTFLALCGAFVIGGLRELGEPARKALIVDLALPAVRARTIGLYYLIRSLCIAPAAYIGGLLWQASPQWPFYAAGVIGVAGVAVFVMTVDEGRAG
jgi:MFS family permease